MELPLQHFSDEAESTVGRRIVVVGTSGSGKTTLARQLARLLHIPCVEMDALHWEPGWIEAPDDVLRERTIKAISGDAWVVDGNYNMVRDLVWSWADTVIWLDYTLPVMLWRVFSRTVRRMVTREELWTGIGNRERFRSAFLSRDSILLWVLTTYRQRRREYPHLFASPEYSHIRFIRLRTPRATQGWLRSSVAQDRGSSEATTREPNYL